MSKKITQKILFALFYFRISYQLCSHWIQNSNSKASMYVVQKKKKQYALETQKPIRLDHCTPWEYLKPLKLFTCILSLENKQVGKGNLNFSFLWQYLKPSISIQANCNFLGLRQSKCSSLLFALQITKSKYYFILFFF